MHRDGGVLAARRFKLVPCGEDIRGSELLRAGEGGGPQKVAERASREVLHEGVGKTLYRAMREAPEGRPASGPTGRTLGVRPHIDIPVDSSDRVHPGTGGMSVAPDAPTNLPRHRRPPEHGGTGKDPVWGMQEGDLGPHLRYVSDDVLTPTHGVVEPVVPMAYEAYQRVLEGTAPYWTRY